MAKELFNSGKHRCMVFDDLLKEAHLQGGDVQSNQFLITHTGPDNYEEGLLFDPGGSKLVTILHQQLTKYIPTNRIRKLVLSHQDPDIGAGAAMWLMMAGTNTKIYVSNLWVRFVPHFSRSDIKDDVFVPIPDEGMTIDLNTCSLRMVPAHFLHSPGNFQLYDPLARILFSGDLGTSLLSGEPFSPVTDFEGHIKHMEVFHRRYMSANRACRLWAGLVRSLDIEMIIPQHGTKYFAGKAMVNKFIDWVESLACGADVLSEDLYAGAKAVIVSNKRSTA